MSLEIDIKEAARALLIAAGMAANVAQADISGAARDIAKNYPRAQAQQVEAEIARHLRNRG
ncbi:hypothetical protein ABZ942_28565 [Nocardia sp. NPDC046473]|uniref:hypothetical protein n=1 Tax=Nocardia sp. NPDC046473 TaxID=3155733 RepID=UPI0033EB6040